jgi:hypothetical protein
MMQRAEQTVKAKPPPMIHIVKVQRPLVGTGYLIYPEGRPKNLMTYQDVDKRVRAAMGDDLKSYHLAVWKNGRWDIGERVADQPW